MRQLALLFLVVTALVFTLADTDDTPGDDNSTNENVETAEEPVEVPSDEEIKKMRVKALKQFIAERGAVCHGCIEKSHLVEKAIEVKNEPLVPKEPEKPPKADLDDEQLKDILESLQNKQKQKQTFREQLKKAGIDVPDGDDDFNLQDFIKHMKAKKEAEAATADENTESTGDQEEAGENIEL